MREVVLDTSFILIAVKQKVDFFEKIENEGFKCIIPLQVFKELKNLGARLALKIILKNKFYILNIKGKDADEAILKYAKKNPNAIIATMDQGLIKKLKNRKMIIRKIKKIEII
ncbi:MAG: hypothetical protein KatS3mg001_079 [Candidatus Pacearchaeota archaeon]|nr:MAG: hypothetical protein KatS3mg001_079 [Candidatus Pacearchaeota archaeon]